MDGLRYEHFVRHAFETKIRYDSQNWNREAIIVERGEDPAHLAEAGLFNTSTLSTKVKVATAYSMEVYSGLFKNEPSISNNLSEKDYGRMNSIIDDVLNAKTHDELSKLIREYQDSFVNTYVPLLQQP